MKRHTDIREWITHLAVGFLFLFVPHSVFANEILVGMASFVLSGNRAFAQATFEIPGGASHLTYVFVDLGSPSMVLSPDLYKALTTDGAHSLTVRVGHMPVKVDLGTVTSDPSLPFPLGNGRMVEGVLPAGAMQNFQVRVDYASQTIMLAKPGTLKPEGVAVPMRVNGRTGLVAVDAVIDGETRAITIDNGSGYTWIRKSAAQPWLARHPDWERGVGAVGPSNMRMADDGIEATGVLLRIPEVALGTLRLEHIDALAIGPDKSGRDFVDWYSKKNAVPVVGWLGGNVLKAFRLTIDYPNRVTYWLRQTDTNVDDRDYVGLTLVSSKHRYFVAGVATQHGRRSVDGVEVGDHLLRIGNLETDGATRQAIFDAMHGKPGETRELTLDRAGRRFTVTTHVTAF